MDVVPAQTQVMSPDDLDGFVAEHYRRLVGLLVLRVGRRDIAEDLAHESLIKLVKNWDRVRVMDNPWAWLATVAINQSISRWRRLAVAERTERRLAVDETGPDHESLTDLLQVVAALPERQRTALLLRHHARLSVRETATAMGCAEGTVKSLTNRATNNLRATLNEEIDDAND